MQLSYGNKKILQIAIPSIVSNITVPLLGLIDVTIVGHLGSAAYIGAIAVGGMLFNIIYWIFGFLRMGTSGMTSQAYGRHDLNEVTLSLIHILLFPILFLCSKVLRNGKSRHNRSMVDTVKLHLVTNIYRIRQRFGHIGKDFIHFRTRLHPFLLGVKHTVGVIQIFSRTQANQTVVCFGILLVYKVNVIGCLLYTSFRRIQ